MPVKRKRRKSAKQQQSPKVLFWILGTLIALGALIFSDLGLLRLYRLNREKQEIQAEIVRLQSEIAQLSAEKSRLDENSENFDPDYIIQIAREKYRMVKKGEKVFRVDDRRVIE